jgi:hypothetical protein
MPCTSVTSVLKGVRSVSVEVQAQTVAKVTLELAIFDLIYYGETKVIVEASQRAILVALGWTPLMEARRPALTHRRALDKRLD